MTIGNLLIRGLLILLTVATVSAGQLMFKYVSVLLVDGHPINSLPVLATALGAFFVSGCGSLIYIWLLRFMPLSVAYPFMSLSFLVVPIVGSLVYREILSPAYFLGGGLIVAGLVVVTGFSR